MISNPYRKLQLTVQTKNSVPVVSADDFPIVYPFFLSTNKMLPHLKCSIPSITLIL